MNKYKPLKLDASVVAAQGTAFVTGRKGGKGKKGAKYLPNDEWNALSADAKAKLIKSQKKVDTIQGLKNGHEDDKFVTSGKSEKTIKSL